MACLRQRNLYHPETPSSTKHPFTFIPLINTQHHRPDHSGTFPAIQHLPTPFTDLNPACKTSTTTGKLNIGFGRTIMPLNDQPAVLHQHPQSIDNTIKLNRHPTPRRILDPTHPARNCKSYRHASSNHAAFSTSNPQYRANLACSNRYPGTLHKILNFKGNSIDHNQRTNAGPAVFANLQISVQQVVAGIKIHTVILQVNRKTPRASPRFHPNLARRRTHNHPLLGLQLPAHSAIPNTIPPLLPSQPHSALPPPRKYHPLKSRPFPLQSLNHILTFDSDRKSLLKQAMKSFIRPNNHIQVILATGMRPLKPPQHSIVTSTLHHINQLPASAHLHAQNSFHIPCNPNLYEPISPKHRIIKFHLNSRPISIISRQRLHHDTGHQGIVTDGSIFPATIVLPLPDQSRHHCRAIFPISQQAQPANNQRSVVNAGNTITAQQPILVNATQKELAHPIDTPMQFNQGHKTTRTPQAIYLQQLTC